MISAKQGEVKRPSRRSTVERCNGNACEAVYLQAFRNDDKRANPDDSRLPAKPSLREEVCDASLQG